MHRCKQDVNTISSFKRLLHATTESFSPYVLQRILVVVVVRRLYVNIIIRFFFNQTLAVAANRTVSLVRNRHFHVFHAEYATDTVTICPNNRLFFHTRFTVDPWIQINLGQSTDIAMVVIYNRQTKEGQICSF